LFSGYNRNQYQRNAPIDSTMQATAESREMTQEEREAVEVDGTRLQINDQLRETSGVVGRIGAMANQLRDGSVEVNARLAQDSETLAKAKEHLRNTSMPVPDDKSI
jgi:hypothetical protein